MNQPLRQPAFGMLKATVALTATAGACWGLLRLLLSDEQTLVSATVAAVWLLSVLGLLPVTMLGHRGVLPTVAGYFVGMFIRMIGCLGGYLLVLYLTQLPSTPLAVALAGTYMPLLLVEVTCVGRYLWEKDFLEPAATEAATC